MMLFSYGRLDISLEEVLETLLMLGGLGEEPGERFRSSDRKPEREETRTLEAHLAAAYYLDEWDPDTLILRLEVGTFVAAFSSSEATTEGLVEAVREEDHEVMLGLAYEGEEDAAQAGRD